MDICTWNAPGYRDPIDSPEIRTLFNSIILQFNRPDMPEDRYSTYSSCIALAGYFQRYRRRIGNQTSKGLLLYSTHYVVCTYVLVVHMCIPSACCQEYLYENNYALVTERFAKSSNHRGSAHREAG